MQRDQKSRCSQGSRDSRLGSPRSSVSSCASQSPARSSMPLAGTPEKQAPILASPKCEASPGSCSVSSAELTPKGAGSNSASRAHNLRHPSERRPSKLFLDEDFDCSGNIKESAASSDSDSAPPPLLPEVTVTKLQQKTCDTDVRVKLTENLPSLASLAEEEVNKRHLKHDHEKHSEQQHLYGSDIGSDSEWSDSLEGLFQEPERISTGKEEKVTIDGVDFLSFESKEDLLEFTEMDVDYINSYKTVDIEETSRNHQPIIPTKTKDITKIKGWRNKLFAGHNYSVENETPTLKSTDKTIKDNLHEAQEKSTKSDGNSSKVEDVLPSPGEAGKSGERNTPGRSTEGETSEEEIRKRDKMSNQSPNTIFRDIHAFIYEHFKREFEIKPNPSKEEFEALSRAYGLKEEHVRHWFKMLQTNLSQTETTAEETGAVQTKNQQSTNEIIAGILEESTEKSNHSLSKRKRLCKLPCYDQLVEHFSTKNCFPSNNEYQELANKYHLTSHQVQVWFNNYRSRNKIKILHPGHLYCNVGSCIATLNEHQLQNYFRHLFQYFQNQLLLKNLLTENEQTTEKHSDHVAIQRPNFDDNKNSSINDDVVMVYDSKSPRIVSTIISTPANSQFSPADAPTTSSTNFTAFAIPVPVQTFSSNTTVETFSSNNATKEIPKRSSHRMTPDKISVLIQAFRKNKYPNSIELDALAKSIGLSKQKVHIWFNTRRYQSDKKKRKLKKYNKGSTQQQVVIDLSSQKATEGQEDVVNCSAMTTTLQPSSESSAHKLNLSINQLGKLEVEYWKNPTFRSATEYNALALRMQISSDLVASWFIQRHWTRLQLQQEMEKIEVVDLLDSSSSDESNKMDTQETGVPEGMRGVELREPSVSSGCTDHGPFPNKMHDETSKFTTPGCSMSQRSLEISSSTTHQHGNPHLLYGQQYNNTGYVAGRVDVTATTRVESVSGDAFGLCGARAESRAVGQGESTPSSPRSSPSAALLR